ncbi:MAG TPA: ABC transporter substrate-binding protein [Firmicutes bacterium]|mgnify:CR=1 FL=1|jgi:iron complex transport system substrate-binding protein|nr:ABC transporter substrate-binding protein [Bacillota bacterium]
MTTKKLLSIVFLILGLCVLATGCGGETHSVVNDENDLSGPADGGVQVRLLEDDLGRKVEISDQPERVLVLNSSMTEMVFELGVIPVGKVSEYVIPRPEAEDLPEISFENSPNIEIINQLAPDLIIAHVRNHGQILDSLEATGAAVFYIDPNEAEDQLIGSIELIGELLNRQPEAFAHIKKAQDRATELREKLLASPIKTALLIQGGDQAVRAAQDFCFWGRLLYLLGIENIVPEEVAKTTKAGFVNFDIETVIQEDPDALLVLQPGFRNVPEGNQGQGGGEKGGGNQGQQGKSSDAAKTQQPGKSISPEELLAIYQNDPMWQRLSAVKNGRIYIVPDNVSPGRIGTIDALEVMAGLLMPENI